MSRNFCRALKRRTNRFRLHPDPLGIGSDGLRFAWIRLVYSIYAATPTNAELSIRYSYVIGPHERNFAFHSAHLVDRIQAIILH
jgi:hypothetical protein